MALTHPILHQRCEICCLQALGHCLPSKGEVFNISLHVPALRVEEIVRVMQALQVFHESDVPMAVDTLTTHCSRTVPLKKLLLWVEMAKQEIKPGEKTPVERWQETLRDLAS